MSQDILYFVIVDGSGSMRPYRNQVVTFLTQILDSLEAKLRNYSEDTRPDFHFAVSQFANHTTDTIELTHLNPLDAAHFEATRNSLLNFQFMGGGTNYSAAVQKASSYLDKKEWSSAHIVFLTDGESDNDMWLMIQGAMERSAFETRRYAIGIGRAVKESTLRKWAGPEPLGKVFHNASTDTGQLKSLGRALIDCATKAVQGFQFQLSGMRQRSTVESKFTVSIKNNFSQNMKNIRFVFCPPAKPTENIPPGSDWFRPSELLVTEVLEMGKYVKLQRGLTLKPHPNTKSPLFLPTKLRAIAYQRPNKDGEKEELIWTGDINVATEWFSGDLDGPDTINALFVGRIGAGKSSIIDGVITSVSEIFVEEAPILHRDAKANQHGSLEYKPYNLGAYDREKKLIGNHFPFHLCDLWGVNQDGFNVGQADTNRDEKDIQLFKDFLIGNVDYGSTQKDIKTDNTGAASRRITVVCFVLSAGSFALDELLDRFKQYAIIAINMKVPVMLVVTRQSEVSKQENDYVVSQFASKANVSKADIILIENYPSGAKGKSPKIDFNYRKILLTMKKKALNVVWPIARYYLANTVDPFDIHNFDNEKLGEVVKMAATRDNEKEEIWKKERMYSLIPWDARKGEPLWGKREVMQEDLYKSFQYGEFHPYHLQVRVETREVSGRIMLKWDNSKNEWKVWVKKRDPFEAADSVPQTPPDQAQPQPQPSVSVNQQPGAQSSISQPPVQSAPPQSQSGVQVMPYNPTAPPTPISKAMRRITLRNLDDPGAAPFEVDIDANTRIEEFREVLRKSLGLSDDKKIDLYSPIAECFVPEFEKVLFAGDDEIHYSVYD